MVKIGNNRLILRDWKDKLRGCRKIKERKVEGLRKLKMLRTRLRIEDGKKRIFCWKINIFQDQLNVHLIKILVMILMRKRRMKNKIKNKIKNCNGVNILFLYLLLFPKGSLPKAISEFFLFV